MTTAVLEIGGQNTRIGLLTSVEPLVLSTVKNEQEEFKHKNNVINVNNSKPMINGIVENWKAIEELCHYSFEKIAESEKILKKCEKNVVEDKFCPESILLIEHYPKAKSEKMKFLELLFESCGVKRVLPLFEGPLPLYAIGSSTGCVLHSGADTSHVVNVWDGYSISGDKRSNIGGNTVNNHLVHLLRKGGLTFGNVCHDEIAENIKKKHCGVTTEEKARSVEKMKLPDGSTIDLCTEDKACGDVLFKRNGLSTSLQELIEESRKEMEVEVRAELIKEIILSGGNTLLNGFAERLLKEVAKGKIRAVENRDLLNWKGGYVAAKSHSFEWITKENYVEMGTKCIGK